jgi:hypothetical protein
MCIPSSLKSANVVDPLGLYRSNPKLADPLGLAKNKLADPLGLTKETQQEAQDNQDYLQGKPTAAMKAAESARLNSQQAADQNYRRRMAASLATTQTNSVGLTNG